MSELVSVVVPVYGVEDYVERCIRSLGMQSYTALEIILVDDGSLDRSGDICDEAAARDPRIRVIHQDNAGPAGAMNAGLDTASGEFVMFVGADDWVHPDLVAHLVSILRENGANVAGCRYVHTETADVQPTEVVGEVQVAGAMEALRWYSGPQSALMTSPCAKLFSSRLWDGVRFPAQRHHEDEFTTYRVIARADLIALSSSSLYYYYNRQGSLTRRVKEAGRLRDRADALRERAYFFRSIGLDDPGSESLLEAFRCQRQVGHLIQSTKRGAERKKWQRDVRVAAAELRGAKQPMSVKVVATAYAYLPGLTDQAIGAYRRLANIYSHGR